MLSSSQWQIKIQIIERAQSQLHLKLMTHQVLLCLDVKW